MEGQSCLEVQMLGGFSMTFNGRKIPLGKNQTTKGLRLLQLLLHTYPAGITRQEVLRCLFGQEMQGKTGNNMRVVVHNLRKLLRESGLPDENYIHANEGKYYFVSSFPVQVDVVMFEQLIRRAAQEEGEKKLELLQKASLLYNGFFLPSLAGEEWVVVLDAYYQRMYLDCMEEICRMMKERKEYEQLIRYCGRAAALYPFDEWQAWQIECLLKLDRLKEALELYEKTTAMYYDELGLPPSERMLSLQRQMNRQAQPNISDFNQIQRSLKENSEENGAFYCSYLCFMNLYRMVARMMERSEQPNHLMLCTIADDQEKPMKESRQLREVSESLQESIHDSLRRGDVFTRYNLNQFLIVLMGIHEKECAIISRRIETLFREKVNNPRIRLLYRVAPIVDA